MDNRLVSRESHSIAYTVSGAVKWADVTLGFRPDVTLRNINLLTKEYWLN